NMYCYFSNAELSLRFSEIISVQVPPSPLLLSQDEFGEIGKQLVLLVDALLLDAVPTLLFGEPQGTWDVVSKVQPLLLGQVVSWLFLTSLQVADGLVVVLQLQVTLAQEEVGLDRLGVHLQRVLAVRQGFVVLLQLQVAQSPVGVVHRHQRVTLATHDGFAVAGGSLLVLAAEEQSVALFLQLLCRGTLLRAACHLLRWLRGACSALLPYPVPRLSGWLAVR
uniref:Uncharacterized protein n=1 Tax=Oncorhynchus tshawytscha TaxID=74940 RepID=A0A8C8CUC9_ONCTS